MENGWIEEMRIAMIKMSAEDVAKICSKVTSADECEKCPFRIICDWVMEFNDNHAPSDFYEGD